MQFKFAAPMGKVQVVGVDYIEDENYVVDVFDSADEAFIIADNHNRTRISTKSDEYFVYDDHGKLVAREEEQKLSA